MAYDVDWAEKGLLKLHVRKFLLYPDYWKDPANNINQGLSWKKYKFNKSNLTKIPNSKGIYCFVTIPKMSNFLDTRYLFYVGKTSRTLKIRFSEYLRDLEGKGKPRSKIYEMLNLYNNYLHFFYAEIQLDSDIDEIEEKLINTFVPHINTDVPKAKVNPELKDIYV